MAWIGYATPQAKRIVLDIIRHHAQSFAGPSSEAGLSTRQIYESAIRNYNEATKSYVPKKPENFVHKKKSGKIVTTSWPPNDEHPIRSMKYLKQVVLEDLSERGLIEKFHKKRPPNEIEQKALDSQRQRALRRNAAQLSKDLSCLDETVSEWLWRRRAQAEEKWAMEEKWIEKTEQGYRASFYWPDEKTKGMRQDPYGDKPSRPAISESVQNSN